MIKKKTKWSFADREEPEFKLYKRLYMALEDLLLASHFANFIDKENFHYKPWQKRQVTQIKQAAYTIALINCFLLQTFYQKSWFTYASGRIPPIY